MFIKLIQDGTSFHINRSAPFISNPISQGKITEVLEFSYNMTYGKKGQHRAYRTGGQHSRKNGELFCNTFQGKLAEFVVYNELINLGFTLSKPDLQTWGLGVWDDTDLNINDKKLSVKSAAFFSNLLLLETKDWDTNGIYLPNNTSYDITILVRIKPDIKKIFREHRIFYMDELSFETLEDLLLTESYYYDIPGYITTKDLKNLIENDFVLPQNSLLNGRIKMDASNYYIQSGDLKKLSSIMHELR